MKGNRAPHFRFLAWAAAAALLGPAALVADEGPEDDPLIDFSTLLGGCQGESNVLVDVAPDGTIWVAGISSSPDYLPGLPKDPGAYGQGHLRVTRFDPDTHEALSTLRIPGTETPWGIRVDADGAAFVVGYVSERNRLVPTTGIDSSAPRWPEGSSQSHRDVYLLKIAADGSEVAWSAILGGAHDEFHPSLAIAGDGDPVVCTSTLSGDFPLAAPFQFSRGGDYDVALVRVEADGSGIVHSSYLGGAGADIAMGVAVDADGDYVISAETADASFLSASRLVGGEGAAARQGILVEIAADGSSVQRAALLGDSVPWRLAVDGDDLLVCGVTRDPEFPAEDAPHGEVHSDEHDAFLLRLDADWDVAAAALYGGTGWERPMSIAVGADGLVWMFGDTRVKDLPMPASTRPFVGGFVDAFAAAFEVGDLSLRCATYYGGRDWQGAGSCATDAAGGLWIVGSAGFADIPYVDPLLEKDPDEQPFDHYLARLLPGDPAGCPEAPQALLAEARIDGTVRLSWLDASTNETAFAIFRRDVDPFSTLSVGDIGFRRIAVVHDATEWVDEDIIEGVTYEWAVQAFNGSGGSAPSDLATLTLGESLSLMVKRGSQTNRGTVRLRGEVPVGQDPFAVFDPRECGIRIEFDGRYSAGILRQVAPGADGWRQTRGALVYRGTDFRVTWRPASGKFEVVLRRAGRLTRHDDPDRDFRIALGCRAGVRSTEWRELPGGGLRLR